VARVCDICGRKPVMGNQITRSGLAKAKGGIGLHTGGISRRKFAVNLHTMRVMMGKTVKRVRVCSRCLKAGKVQRPVRRVRQAAPVAS
jgi:large subunit ribosomal protein L28